MRLASRLVKQRSRVFDISRLYVLRQEGQTISYVFREEKKSVQIQDCRCQLVSNLNRSFHGLRMKALVIIINAAYDQSTTPFKA